MTKKVLSVLTATIILINTLFSFITANAADVENISTLRMLRRAFSTSSDATYALSADILVKNSGITAPVTLDGNGHYLRSNESGAGATIYQNENVSSQFNNLIIYGNTKDDVGIWGGAGSITFNNSSITEYNINTGQMSAIAIAGSTALTLNDTIVKSNSNYDIALNDNSVLNINGTSEIESVRLRSQFSKINIGNNWSGTFTISFDYNPVCKTIGKVSQNADISGIKITNDGYYVDNDNGNLVVKSYNEREIRFDFDLSVRDTLYKGSSGFLYGAAEINVPSIDLLQGLKPDTMVQKTIGGLQHPTGDAVRTKSSVLSAGARDMQIYFQDTYLEWPYDAPMKNGAVDIDSYQKSVESMLYNMICTKADSDDADAFLGTDGNYYVLNKELAENYSYVLFNEPDQIWFGGRLNELKEAWKQIYNAVHAIDPDARCVGPNYSGFNESNYNDFLSYCRDNNCLPEIISWHELGDISLTDFNKHYDAVERFVSQYYVDSQYQPQLMVNEYARHYDIGAPGGLIKWLSMFEDKDMSGCMAYWAMANSLNELAADQNSPSSSWWVYHWYAQMTGAQCPLTYPAFENTRLYGTASYDDSINMGYVLFGGNEDDNGTETVYLDNIKSTNLLNANNAVNVKLYAVSFSGQQGANYAPMCIFNGAVSAEQNYLKLKVTQTDEMDAFFAVLTKPEDDAQITEMNNISIPVLSYEAENAILIGNATAYPKIGWATFATSGRADVGNLNNNGDGVEFNVSVPESGTYKASIFYSLQAPYVNPITLSPDANGQNRGIGKTLPYAVYVDGNKLPDIYLQSTVSWLYKNHNDFDITLSSGNHKIKFVHINGDERNKGNLQLTAAFDKLDLERIDNIDTRYDFDINLNEMTNFKDNGSYRITAVAPVSGYYNISADCDVTLAKQSINYAKDANTYSEVSTFDIPVSNTVYLSQGANTIISTGNASVLHFTYDKEKTDASTSVVTCDNITLHGNNPKYKDNSYANNKKVIADIGIGQNQVVGDSADKNYAYFKVNAETEGVYNLAIRYSNDEPAPVMQKADGSTYIHPYNIDLVERYAQISVNSSEPETVYFRNTMSWDTFKTVDIQVNLQEGENLIKIFNDNSYQFSPLVNSTAPEIDTVSISKLSYDSQTVSLIPKTDNSAHNYTKQVIQPSYDAQGYTVYTCSECGFTYNGDYTAPLVKPIENTDTNNNQNTATDNNSIQDSKPQENAQTSQQTQTNSSVQNGSSSSNNTSVKAEIGPKGAVKINGEWISKKQKNTKITKLKKGKKSFKATWKKVKGISGYQVQCATDKKFKKNKKTVTIKGNKSKKPSKTVKKLKAKKKYYVRIRTYKTVKVNGKSIKVYSKWSSAKKVVVK